MFVFSCGFLIRNFYTNITEQQKIYKQSCRSHVHEPLNENSGQYNRLCDVDEDFHMKYRIENERFITSKISILQQKERKSIKVIKY